MKTTKKTLLGLAAALLALAACKSTPNPVLPDGLHIGEAIEPQEILPFAAVEAAPQDHFHRTLLVEADVAAVCQRKGCWMQIEDQGKTALVRWESGCGGQYAFPFDATGKHVLLQGSFYPKEVAPEDVEHLQEEAGGAVEIPRQGWEFNVSGVILVGANG